MSDDTMTAKEAAAITFPAKPEILEMVGNEADWVKRATLDAPLICAAAKVVAQSDVELTQRIKALGVDNALDFMDALTIHQKSASAFSEMLAEAGLRILCICSRLANEPPKNAR